MPTRTDTLPPYPGPPSSVNNDRAWNGNSFSDPTDLQQPPPVYTENPQDERPALVDQGRPAYSAPSHSQEHTQASSVAGGSHSASYQNEERRWTRPGKAFGGIAFTRHSIDPERQARFRRAHPESNSGKLALDTLIRFFALLSVFPAAALCARAIKDEPSLRSPGLLGFFSVILAAGIDFWRLNRSKKNLHERNYPFSVGLPLDIIALAFVAAGTCYLRFRVDRIDAYDTAHMAVVATTVSFAPRALLFLIALVAVIQRLKRRG